MSKIDIHIVPENCTGCRCCQLCCSDLYSNAFKISQARIIIDDSHGDVKITFSEECNHCCVCVEFCLYDALTKNNVPGEQMEEGGGFDG